MSSPHKVTVTHVHLRSRLSNHRPGFTSLLMQLADGFTEIIKHGVCLGRAPGFRRRDVDLAVQKALVSAY